MTFSSARTATIGLVWLTAAALVLSACASTPESDAEPAPTGSEFVQGETEPPEPTPVAGSTSMDLASVYFDFDRSEIRDDARPVLRTNAEMLGDARGTITIEGHCDERGDEEYNLALGESRAHAVKRYLVNLGVPSAQLRTLSYGEAKPAVQGHDEAAWRWNRRAEFRAGS